MHSNGNAWSSWRSTKYPGVYYRERSGKRVYAIDFRDDEGKRHRERIDGGLEDARRALAAITSKPEKPKRTNLTLEEMFGVWLNAPRRKGQLMPGTRRQYECNFRNHVPVNVKRKRLSDIHEEDVLRVIENTRHLSPWTAGGILKTVSGPLRLAMRKGYISKNAVANLLPEEKPQRGARRQTILQPDEVATVLRVCPPKYLALISLAIYSGLRQSELLGLRWQDIDLDELTVRVADQLGKDRLLVGHTKNRRERVVYIPAQVATNLKSHARWQTRTDDPAAFVFASPSGRPRSQEWARKTWTAVRGKAGVSARVRFHDLRHTFASILISNGASGVELAGQLGDSVEVALSTYAGLFDRAQSETKLRSILANSYPGAATG